MKIFIALSIFVLSNCFSELSGSTHEAWSDWIIENYKKDSVEEENNVAEAESVTEENDSDQETQTE